MLLRFPEGAICGVGVPLAHRRKGRLLRTEKGNGFFFYAASIIAVSTSGLTWLLQSDRSLRSRPLKGGVRRLSMQHHWMNQWEQQHNFFDRSPIALRLLVMYSYWKEIENVKRDMFGKPTSRCQWSNFAGKARQLPESIYKLVW
jgi:hypothetical protein